ncbi:MAG TPA: LysM peptidoglycan-binding domain-containing protein [Vicinamibacterales bacterium]|nr:LysM peptidoglycan-binding domain-containing protein [Vicinamibacterales bacterium]
MPRGCPFLVAEAGGWRLGVPSRDHRCSAVSPAAPLSPDKQIRLCLTPAYASCATYLASVAARTERLGAVPVRRATRWGLARTTSVIEDRGGLRSRIASSLTERARWPAVPAVLLVVTLFALALSGFRGGTPAAAGATASPRPSSQEATPHPTRPAPPSTPAASAEASMPPGATPATPQPTPTAAVTPRPSASFRTYVVEAGDTLGAIANRFGTTVRAIAELNGIADPSRLQIGQVLRIP